MEVVDIPAINFLHNELPNLLFHHVFSQDTIAATHISPTDIDSQVMVCAHANYHLERPKVRWQLRTTIQNMMFLTFDAVQSPTCEVVPLTYLLSPYGVDAVPWRYIEASTMTVVA